MWMKFDELVSLYKSDKEAADALGVSQAYVSMHKRTDIKYPSFEVAKIIYYNCDRIVYPYSFNAIAKNEGYKGSDFANDFLKAYKTKGGNGRDSNAKELADKLGISLSALYNTCYESNRPSIKVASRIYTLFNKVMYPYDEEAIKLYIKENTNDK